MALTIKQERFANLYVELGNASEAYRRAYDAEGMSPEDIGNEGYRLTIHPEVAPKIESLRGGMAQKHAVTRESLAQELENIRAAAEEAGQYAPAVSAVAGKMKLYGLGVENQRVTTETVPEKPDLGKILADAEAKVEAESAQKPSNSEADQAELKAEAEASAQGRNPADHGTKTAQKLKAVG